MVTMLWECVMILIAFWTNQLLSSTPKQPWSQSTRHYCAEWYLRHLLGFLQHNRVLDRLDFWHGRVFTSLHSKSMVNLFCLKRDLGTIPQKCSVLEHSILMQMQETVKANPMTGNCISQRKTDVFFILHCIKTFAFDDQYKPQKNTTKWHRG